MRRSDEYRPAARGLTTQAYATLPFRRVTTALLAPRLGSPYCRGSAERQHLFLQFAGAAVGIVPRVVTLRRCILALFITLRFRLRFGDVRVCIHVLRGIWRRQHILRSPLFCIPARKNLRPATSRFGCDGRDHSTSVSCVTYGLARSPVCNPAHAWVGLLYACYLRSPSVRLPFYYRSSGSVSTSSRAPFGSVYLPCALVLYAQRNVMNDATRMVLQPCHSLLRHWLATSSCGGLDNVV